MDMCTRRAATTITESLPCRAASNGRHFESALMGQEVPARLESSAHSVHRNNENLLLDSLA
jgi:hypothetical protein